MKKIVTILFLLSALVSCSDSIRENVDVNMLESQTWTTGQENHVALADVLTLSNAQMPGTRANTNASSDIECVTNDSNDTLLYVVNKHGGGWTIYSSDTRVPAIVAQSDEGSFSELMQNEHAAIWIQSMAEDIGLIKSLDDDALNFTKEEIESNKAFWKSVSSPDDFVKEHFKQETTKGREHPGLIDPPGPIPVGHYELAYSEVVGIAYDSIGRLTKTDWDQNFPFNAHCPYRSDTVNAHAPAGCVAIAAAQLLFFLNDSLGVPATAPSQAYCNSDVDDYPNYDWGQSNFDSTIWNYMNYWYLYAAPLIADIGRCVNMHYGNNGSGAQLGALVNNVFLPYGISCTYSSYDTYYLKSNLSNGFPVILGAKSSVGSGDGHAFIADRYKNLRQIIKNYYSWVWDYIPPLTPVPDYDEMIEYTYSSPIITWIGMNWGWGWPYNNIDEWYSITSDWIIETENETYNYNINRHMIYSFHVANN